ncbi:hypothetical protein EVA_17124 [gut metagenome]|uniref:Uncharacterized protein n=1 Tax=gut metagenome TaxID=749906 RepID=J9C4M7_9ZZZZ
MYCYKNKESTRGVLSLFYRFRVKIATITKWGHLRRLFA